MRDMGQWHKDSTQSPNATHTHTLIFSMKQLFELSSLKIKISLEWLQMLNYTNSSMNCTFKKIDIHIITSTFHKPKCQSGWNFVCPASILKCAIHRAICIIQHLQSFGILILIHVSIWWMWNNFQSFICEKVQIWDNGTKTVHLKKISKLW
jgi:hypothetical protein